MAILSYPKSIYGTKFFKKPLTLLNNPLPGVLGVIRELLRELLKPSSAIPYRIKP